MKKECELSYFSILGIERQRLTDYVPPSFSVQDKMVNLHFRSGTRKGNKSDCSTTRLKYSQSFSQPTNVNPHWEVRHEPACLHQVSCELSWYDSLTTGEVLSLPVARYDDADDAVLCSVTTTTSPHTSIQPGTLWLGPMPTRWDCDTECLARNLLFQIVIKWLAHSVATPALLCHKEPAQGTQSPLLGAFLAFRWFFMA